MYIYIYIYIYASLAQRGGLGGGGAPTPGTMVKRVRVLPCYMGRMWVVFRDPLEVLWGSWGSCGGPEGSGGARDTW